jgi:hypothetical protein
MDWNEYVNKKISLDGDYSQETGFVQEIRFDNGKSRTWQKNSYIPIVYSELSLILNNKEIITDEIENTEFKQFKWWYEVVLRNGILPFYFPVIGKPEEVGVYQFLPQSLKFDDTDGLITASFGFKEIAQMDGEIQSNLWVTLHDHDSSDELPSSGKVNKILQQIRNFLKWVKENILGINIWLPPVNTVSQLQLTGLNNKKNYLCKVIADPVQSGVYQAVAGWEDEPVWELFDDTVDLVNEQELESGIERHNTDIEAHNLNALFVHIENTNNPHEVTKSQIGLGNLDNYQQATKVEFNGHLEDLDNPHKVTKHQVELGNVSNDAQVKRTEMGAANGVATLGAQGTIPASQLPEGGGILAVAHDNSLKGEGISGNPLGIKFPIIVPSKSGEVSNEPTLLATEAQVYDTIDKLKLKNITSIVSLTEDNKESELAAIYGGIWYRITSPTPRTLRLTTASGNTTISDVISDNNYYLKSIGQGAIVTVETTGCGNYLAELISTTRGIIQTQPVVSGIFRFNSVTIQENEHLYIRVEFYISNIFTIKYNWTSGINRSVTEYIYVKEQEIKHEII